MKNCQDYTAHTKLATDTSTKLYSISLDKFCHTLSLRTVRNNFQNAFTVSTTRFYDKFNASTTTVFHTTGIMNFLHQKTIFFTIFQTLLNI